jgi:SAM-dependent methyltransferase
MAEDDVDSVTYYDRNAERFAADTGGVDMSALYERFLRHVPPGCCILDAGCGVGRDALAFAERGYSVVAFDASVEMVRLAKERTAGRAEVRQMFFDDVAWRGEFDGVWACASLLHVPLAELPNIVQRLAAALRLGGALYMSFKHGSGERVAGGRRFTDLDEASLRNAVAGGGLAMVDVWTTGDVRPGRTGETWLNALATRLSQGEPEEPNASGTTT